MARSLGRHTLIEFFNCSVETLNNPDELEKIMLKATEISGATKIESSFHKFSPHGITGVIIVAESHFSIHTWPEYGYAAVDIFTCGDIIDNFKALDYIYKRIDSSYYSVMEIKRGIIDVSGELKHKSSI